MRRSGAVDDRSTTALGGVRALGSGGRERRWKRPESVLVVVHTADGRVLLLQRADDPRFWQSVTGSLEEGETPAAAAWRELFEETGFDLEPIELGLRSRFEIRGPWRARYAPEVSHNVEHAFAVRLERTRDATLDPDEHLSSRWLSVPDALALASSRTDRTAIRRAAVPGGEERS